MNRLRILFTSILAMMLIALVQVVPAQHQDPLYQRYNFFGMHNLKDGGPAFDEGMEWTQHLVGGGYVFDWVTDFEPWIEKAFQLNLIPCIRVQESSGGTHPSPGYAANAAWVILNYKMAHPEYADRLVYLQLWNEPHDPRDYVPPDVYADYLVDAYNLIHQAEAEAAAAHPGLGLEGTLKIMTPGQNGPSWWDEAFSHNPDAKFAFDIWGTHPYPEATPPHYNLHDGDVFIETSKTIDSYLMDLDVVARPHGNPARVRRGFPVMITETAYGEKLGISYEGWPKTNRQMAADYNADAFGKRWYKWPEIIAVHPFILSNWSWRLFEWVQSGSGSEDINNDGIREPTHPYPQYRAVRQLRLDLEAAGMTSARLAPYRGPTGTIKGAITRSDTDEPIAYATIYTDGYAFGHVSLYDGGYEIHDVPVGTYTLTVEKNGYVSAGSQITINEDQATTMDFRLAYQGKVSRGIYFVDTFAGHSGCSGCDLFAKFLGQTFTVPADVGFIKYVACKPYVDNVTMKFSILAGGPDGPQVATSITATLEAGDGAIMIGAEWPTGQEPVVQPGETYFLKVERADGKGIYSFASDSNPYPGGNAYVGEASHSEWDLYAVIRGLTTENNVATGSIGGTVTDTASNPVSGATITVINGGYTTSTDGDGHYRIENIPAGTYSLSVLKDGYAPQTREGITVSQSATTNLNFTLVETENGFIGGRVKDSAGNLIAGAVVEATPGGQISTTVDDGTYLISALIPNKYTLQVTKPGYLKGIQPGIQVNAGETTIVDFTLEPVPPITTEIENAAFEVDGGFFTVASGWTSFGGNKWESVWDPEYIFTQGITDIPPQGFGGIYQILQVAPGLSYQVKVYAKSTNPALEVALGVDPAGGTDPDTAVFGAGSNTATWTERTVEFTAAGTEATLFLMARNRGSWLYGAWAQFDGATIAKISPSDNTPPFVTITYPVDGTLFEAPATITLEADASDIDDVVHKVVFFNADTKIAEVFDSPYSIEWGVTAPGSYTLTAQAVDSQGAQASSEPITIEVIGSEIDPEIPPIYDITIHPSPSVEPGERWWKLVKFYHLNCEENAGKHNLFIAFYYLDGSRVEQGWQNKVGWTKSDQISGELPLEKDEKIGGNWIHGNLDLYWNDDASLEYLSLNGSNFQVQRLTGVHTRHPDECPGNTLGHHSFVAVYEERIGPDN